MEKIILKKFLIAGGNPTLLVWNASGAQKDKIIKRDLGKVDQIGFVENYGGFVKLEMMGGELCINALLALASQINKGRRILINNLEVKVLESKIAGKVKIKLYLDYKENDDIILLPGIGFKCISKTTSFDFKELEILSAKFNLPAFGFAVYDDLKLYPKVYVKETNSFIDESACGSGSIALNIYKGFPKIVQTTGSSIEIVRKGKVFEVSTEVRLISDSRKVKL